MSCTRYESEGLELEERGLPLGEHFETCPDCVKARLAYAALKEAVGNVDERAEPDPGWRQRVREEIRGEPRRWGRSAWLKVAAAAAVVLVAVTVWKLPDETTTALSLSVTVERGSRTVRSDDVTPGDELVLEARTGGARYSELRVYVDDALVVMSCSHEPPCEDTDGAIRARIEIERIGLYQPLLIVSDTAIPAASGALDDDARRAMETGARVELADPIRAR